MLPPFLLMAVYNFFLKNFHTEFLRFSKACRRRWALSSFSLSEKISAFCPRLLFPKKAQPFREPYLTFQTSYAFREICFRFPAFLPSMRWALSSFSLSEKISAFCPRLLFPKKAQPFREPYLTFQTSYAFRKKCFLFPAFPLSIRWALSSFSLSEKISAFCPRLLFPTSVTLDPVHGYAE